MVDKFNEDKILNGRYEFDVSKYFFAADPIRTIIIVYIIISFILNVLYFISFLRIKSKNAESCKSLFLMINILLTNFVHTFSYLYEWVLQNVDGENSLYVDKDGIRCEDPNICKDEIDKYEIGGLLIGNMENISTCEAQAFFLVFTALAQDILINAFFYLINKQRKAKESMPICLMSLGYIIPLIFSIICLAVGGFGLNDKYCFIKKFSFEEGHGYKLYSGYYPIISIYYCIRVINLIFSCILLYKIVGYVRKNNLNKKYIFKSCTFLIVQIFTTFVGLMYRFGGMFSNKFNRSFVNIFLIINTIDGIIFPAVSYFSNNMYRSFCKDSDSEYYIDILGANDNDISCTDMTLSNQAKCFEKNKADNKNNFDITYDLK